MEGALLDYKLEEGRQGLLLYLPTYPQDLGTMIE